MYALLFPFLFGQCGPGGCAIPSDPSQWQPIVVDRADRQTAVIDVTVIPWNGQVWFDGHALRLVAGKARVRPQPLEPGRYQYRITARWGNVERQWTLSFSPGQTVRVVLQRDEAVSSTPESTAGTASSSVASPSPLGSTEPAQPPPPLPSPPQPSSTTPDATGRVVPPSGPGAAPASMPKDQLPAVEQDGVQNFGIDRSRLNGSTERIMLDGRQITRADAARFLQAGSLVDDSGKLRLTVIGMETDRRRVLDDLKGPLTDIAGQCLVQDYPPDHWAVAKAGFYTAGKPTIYVQDADGKVLHRQDDYADGAPGLRQAFERLRKPDPNYRPDKDRDARKRDGSLLAGLLDFLGHPLRVVLSWLLAAGVVFVLIVLVVKGWLFFFLGYLTSLIPAPPKKRPDSSAPAAPSAGSAPSSAQPAAEAAITGAADRLANLINQQVAQAAAAKDAAVADAVNQLVNQVTAKLSLQGGTA